MSRDLPPERDDTSWLDADHTVEVRVPDELLALSRERRRSKPPVAENTNFAERTVEHRVPDELMGLLRGRQQGLRAGRGGADSGPLLSYCEADVSSLSSSLPAPPEGNASESEPVTLKPAQAARPLISARQPLPEARCRPATDRWALLAISATLLAYCAWATGL